MKHLNPSLLRSAASKLSLTVVMIAVLLNSHLTLNGQTPSLTEHEVKALFLLNFTRYVEWPGSAFANSESPIVIGIIGGKSIETDLRRAITGKTVNGRKVILETDEPSLDWTKCQILFIGAGSKASPTVEALEKVKSLPVLTVGERDRFAQEGGIINFVKRNDRIRLEINLDAARQSGLQINSKLLGVADSVIGKPK